MANYNRLCPGCMKDNEGKQVCPFCGFDSSKDNPSDKLPLRFIIHDRYFVGRVMFSDNENTVYLGYDFVENRPVNIKEYCPTRISHRNPDKTVFTPREAQFLFNEGLMEFISINKKFIGHPLVSLPDTYSVFEAICDTVDGITLKSFLARNGGILKWEQIRPLILPLIDTVKSLHDMSLIHGDISPETVIVCRDKRLRLLGVHAHIFNSAKPDNGLSVPVFHDGYAAPEQYVELHEEVGTYTDVYGLCATILTVITGIVPPTANERIKSDMLKIPAHFADELPRQVLVAIANGMQIKPAERTASIENLKNELIYGETKENIRKSQRAAAQKQQSSDKSQQKGEKKGSGFKYAAIALGVTAAIIVVVLITLALTIFKDSLFGKETLPSVDDPSMPSQQQIGDYDSDAVDSKAFYNVPDLRGKTYVELEEIEELDHFEVVIKNKEYSKTYERGKICAQSIDPGTSKEYGSVIEIVISLGSRQVKMPSLAGMTQEKAQIVLLKTGFLYENIEMVEQYDSSATPGIVLDQYPERGKAVSPESGVRVYVNSYEEESSSDIDSNYSRINRGTNSGTYTNPNATTSTAASTKTNSTGKTSSVTSSVPVSAKTDSTSKPSGTTNSVSNVSANPSSGTTNSSSDDVGSSSDEAGSSSGATSDAANSSSGIKTDSTTDTTADATDSTDNKANNETTDSAANTTTENNADTSKNTTTDAAKTTN